MKKAIRWCAILQKLKDEFQKIGTLKKIYMYVYIFSLIYIEFGYSIVVANKLSGNARTLILLMLTFPLFFLNVRIAVDKNRIFLLLYLSLVVMLNLMRDNTYQNYILLLVPIFIGFSIAAFIDMKIIMSIFSDIMVFLAIYSLATFAISLLWPGVILRLPILGNRLDTSAVVHDALFSVILSNAENIRNYGIAWEPGAFALLLCIATFCEMNITKKILIKRVLVIIFAIVTTFSTMGYIVLAAIIISSVSKRKSLHNRSIGTTIVILATLILIVCILPDDAKKLVFSKLDGLFSEGTGNVAYTTQARLNAIKHPFEAFVSSPLFGVGYDKFSYINKTLCNGVATNTMLNWFAVMGLLFGLPCIVGYLKTVLRVSNHARLNLFAKILIIVASLLLISTESLLRISLVYAIIFYGYGSNNLTEANNRDAISIHSGGL